MAMHLSLECLTIGPAQMSREEQTSPHMEISAGRSVESIAPQRPPGHPAPYTRNKTK